MSSCCTYGVPSVTRFQGGRVAAFTLQLDDNMDSQVQNALPLLRKYDLRASFFVCAGSVPFEARKEVWASVGLDLGHELCNHTVLHADTVGYAQAEADIGKCANAIRAIYGGKVFLVSFGIPGGVKWEVADEDLARIYRKYTLFLPPRTDMFTEEYGEKDILAAPRRALLEGSWRQIILHGIGGGWLNTTPEHFEELLVFLDANQSQIWVAPNSEVYKYIVERDHVTSVRVTGATSERFDIEVRCDQSPADAFDLPFVTVFDLPLTVQVKVPLGWQAATVVQGGKVAPALIGSDGRLLVDVQPNVGPARVRRID